MYEFTVEYTSAGDTKTETFRFTGEELFTRLGDIISLANGWLNGTRGYAVISWKDHFGVEQVIQITKGRNGYTGREKE